MCVPVRNAGRAEVSAGAIRNTRDLGNWVDMSHDYAHSLDPAPARQHPPLRRRLPMPAYEPPPKYSEFLQRMLVRARESLGEEFRGITADGIVRPGLFPVRKTGVSLEPILGAARDFLATLDLRQQRVVSFNIQSDVWRSWSNVHPFLMRHGLGLHELTAAQREAALALVSSALSASGFETARNVMKLNEHACELTGLTEEYSEWYYWLSIFGTPSAFEPWGWQARRPSPDHQLLHTGRSASAHPAVHGLRARARRIGQVRRHAGVPGRGGRRSRHDAGIEPRAAGQGHHRHAPAGRGAHGRLQRQRPHTLRRHPLRRSQLQAAGRATGSDRRLP